MGLQDTPQSLRVHIGIFGRTNSGKSSLLNMITEQDASLVSNTAGTTTDPVYKAMEINGIGPTLFIDTAGFNDLTELGSLRTQKTQKAILSCDIAILLFSASTLINKTLNQVDFSEEIDWFNKLKQHNIPCVPVISKSDLFNDTINQQKDSLQNFSKFIKKLTGIEPICFNTTEKSYKNILIDALKHALPAEIMSTSLTGKLAQEDSLVLLVMPQDIQAPKGRLILPQVQIIRDLLDKKATVISCTTDKLLQSLKMLSRNPDLIITDSQVFKTVYDEKPQDVPLTSFSVLLAAAKGDIDSFIKGASALSKLTENSRVLIAEACTHAPLQEDIGTIKIPRMLTKIIGKQPNITHVSGVQFPQQLTDSMGKPLFDLIIHCGACMFNRAYMISRQKEAQDAGIPLTNYGIAIAYFSGILNNIVLP